MDTRIDTSDDDDTPKQERPTEEAWAFHTPGERGLGQGIEFHTTQGLCISQVSGFNMVVSLILQHECFPA